MNKLKVAIQELREHLGADSQGRALLDEIAEIANVQRKRAAMLEDAAATSEAASKAMRSKLDTAESEVAALKNGLHREAANRTAAESREKTLLLQIKAQAEPEEVAQTTDDVHKSNVTVLLAKVRKRFKKLPTRKFGRYGGLIVEDFILKFSHDEFAGLGMAMSACAFMNLPVTLRAERVVSGKTLSDADSCGFIRWFRDAIHTTKTQDEMFYRFNKVHE